MIARHTTVPTTEPTTAVFNPFFEVDKPPTIDAPGPLAVAAVVNWVELDVELALLWVIVSVVRMVTIDGTEPVVSELVEVEGVGELTEVDNWMVSVKKGKLEVEVEVGVSVGIVSDPINT